jgi:type I restriction enzyme S subunit
VSDLPRGWSWAVLGEICERATKWDPRQFPGQTFTYIDISAINDQRITNAKTLNGAEAPSRARQLVQDGDTLLSTVRTYLRNTALVTPEFDGSTVSTGFCVLRPTAAVEPRFLFHRVLEDRFVEELSARQTGTSYPAVRDADVFDQEVALPPFAEQQRIVEVIEEQLSRIEAIERLLEQLIGPFPRGHGRLGGLRRSIFSHAFRGGLVSQDPSDEPAATLLERIAAGRAGAVKPPRRKGKKTLA